MAISAGAPDQTRSVLTRAMLRGLAIRLVTLAVAGHSLRAQVTTVLPSVPQCSGCSIRLEKVVTLGSVLDGSVKREPSWMARDARGRIYVIYGQRPDLVSVFDSAGRFVLEIGRRGMGPGEFGYPMTVNVDGKGRLLIWDFEGGREVLLDQDFKFVRQNPQRMATILWLPDGRRIANYSALDANNHPAPATVFDSLGVVKVSFGATGVIPIDADPWRVNRRMGLGSNNTVWLAREDMYRLENWDPVGQLLRTFTRLPRWFAPIALRASWTKGEPPTPRVQALQEDGAGHLLYMVSIAAPDWRAALGAPRIVSGTTVYPERIDARIFDTMLDVIDVKSGRLLVSERLGGLYKFFLGPDLVASYRQDYEGNPFIDVWRVRLTLK